MNAILPEVSDKTEASDETVIEHTVPCQHAMIFPSGLRTAPCPDVAVADALVRCINTGEVTVKHHCGRHIARILANQGHLACLTHDTCAHRVEVLAVYPRGGAL